MMDFALFAVVTGLHECHHRALLACFPVHHPTATLITLHLSHWWHAARNALLRSACVLGVDIAALVRGAGCPSLILRALVRRAFAAQNTSGISRRDLLHIHRLRKLVSPGGIRHLKTLPQPGLCFLRRLTDPLLLLAGAQASQVKTSRGWAVARTPGVPASVQHRYHLAPGDSVPSAVLKIG
ncbi:hypothetical protein FB451DRAFT_1385870 [Mycena latifolia]|nr:hypothetical protein FB451DRAFT_1385870 [Mycena latifolia]